MNEQISRWLADAGFADQRAALRSLRTMIGLSGKAQSPPGDWLPNLLAALGESANPDRALVNLERLAHAVPDAGALFRDLGDDPHLLETLITLFCGSQYLSEILLRNPAYLERLRDPKRLAQAKSPEQFDHEAREALESAPGQNHADRASRLNALRRFQRWELLRLGVCDLLGQLDLPTVTTQLAHLADSLVRACLLLAAEETQTSPQGFAVLALGKLGGAELNYSSDIDLIFLAAANASAYARLGENLIDALTCPTAEGFLYRVDMRLRPWGRDGPLIASTDGYLAYLRKHARVWEKQALLKARVIAGEKEVGQAFLEQAAPLIYDPPPGAVRDGVREMKRRIEAELERNGQSWGQVKLGKGSIRDIEFVTQYLQLVHGAACPAVRSPNTLDALSRLRTCGFMSSDEYRILSDGYTFLRPVEHLLQMMDYRQTHAIPKEEREIAYLARRLGFRGADAGAQFLARYEAHSAAIRAIYLQHLEREEISMATNHGVPAPNVDRHVARMAPSYEAAFSEAEIRRHAALAERLSGDNLVEVDAAPQTDGTWRVTIVGYDYTGELSLICGLLFVYGFSIISGHVFTYERLKTGHKEGGLSPFAHGTPSRDEAQRKIVDVFIVRPTRGEVTPDLWRNYAEDLANLLRMLQAGQQREAQGELVKRVAHTLSIGASPTPTLYPVDIEIDNSSSEQYTLLHINAPDTIGFLYEITNALALSGIYIAEVSVATLGSRVQDTLYVTDARGQKITSPNKQRELRTTVALVKHFTHLLPYSPNPGTALMHFGEFLGQLFTQPDWPDQIATLERSDVLGALTRLLGVSDFLWEDFLRMQHANLFPVVRDVDALATARTKEQLRTALEAEMSAAPDAEARRLALNAFKDREMFRVDMRHILGHIAEFGQFSAELTDLAEVVIEAAYRCCLAELQERHGLPLTDDGKPCPIAVCALGKCGGRELGYASDIELMFVYAGRGKTTGPDVITTGEFYEKLVIQVLQAIRARREGIFEIDLQLRPYGSAGSMAVAIESFRRYFAPGGPAWPYERQALIKLRPIAGDEALGDQLVALRDAFVYSGEPFDVTAMRAMRERQIRHLVSAGTINAKFSPGGLVDAEYLVQALQMMHGQRIPALRQTNTREAIRALEASGILSPQDAELLRSAYAFLRQLIDALRMVRGNAKDLTVPPAESEELAFLARRLGYAEAPARLREDLSRHTTTVQELSRRLLG